MTLETARKSRQVAVRPPKLTRDDYQFLPAALEILETPLSPIRTVFTLTICAFVVIALAWSYFGRTDIIAVAQGKIQPVGRTKTVQPLETGKVLALNVANGSKVKAGDVLVDLDPSEAKADESSLSSELKALEAERIRRVAAASIATLRSGQDVPELAWPAETPAPIRAREERVLQGDVRQLVDTVSSLVAQQQSKQAERARLQDTVAAQQQLVATLRQRVDMRASLFSSNSGSKAAVIDAQEDLQKEQTVLAAQSGQISEADAAIRLAARDIAKTYSTFEADNATKLAEAERKIDDDREKLAKARIKTAQMRITSPIDGVVQGLVVTSLGQVLTTGQQILQVVPQGAELEVESYLPNSDIGFVQSGQAAVVKVESFPFTSYGTIDGTVTRVADDAIPQVEADQREGNPVTPGKDEMFGGSQRTQNLVYPVSLTLHRTAMDVDGRTVPLVPGMAVTVEIKTGTRRIIEYLFSPVLRVVTTAIRSGETAGQTRLTTL